jgi:glutamate dehydrogenase (NAD(P)+)
VQGLERYFWTEEEVNSKLEKIMTPAFENVWHLFLSEKVNMRTAWYMLGVKPVAAAMLLRGLYPQ